MLASARDRARSRLALRPPERGAIPCAALGQHRRGPSGRLALRPPEWGM